MLMSRCPGCGALVPYGRGRCDACRRELDERLAKLDRRREYRARKRRAESDDPRYAAFYRSREWRTFSAAFLSRAGFCCEDCGGTACEVHHDPPIREPGGWEHRLDPDHCHALCTRCHNARHGRFGARGEGRRGWSEKFSAGA